MHANVKPVAYHVNVKAGIMFQAKMDIAAVTEILYDNGELEILANNL